MYWQESLKPNNQPTLQLLTALRSILASFSWFFGFTLFYTIKFNTIQTLVVAHFVQHINSHIHFCTSNVFVQKDVCWRRNRLTQDYYVRCASIWTKSAEEGQILFGISSKKKTIQKLHLVALLEFSSFSSKVCLIPRIRCSECESVSINTMHSNFALLFLSSWWSPQTTRMNTGLCKLIIYPCSEWLEKQETFRLNKHTVLKCRFDWYK